MKLVIIFFSTIILNACGNSKQLSAMSNNQNKTLQGTYNVTQLGTNNALAVNLEITFDSIANNVSGFSGCNRFFGPFAIDNNNITFKNLASTKMFCADDEVNSTETLFLNALQNTNRFEINDATIILYDNDNLLLISEKQPEINLEYTAASRGMYIRINVNKNEVSISHKRDGKPETKPCQNLSWNNILDDIKTVDIENIANLEAPSKKFAFDGAAIATLKITYNGETQETVSFDHGNPPKEIAKLVKEILSISENIE